MLKRVPELARNVWPLCGWIPFELNGAHAAPAHKGRSPVLSLMIPARSLPTVQKMELCDFSTRSGGDSGAEVKGNAALERTGMIRNLYMNIHLAQHAAPACLGLCGCGRFF